MEEARLHHVSLTTRNLTQAIAFYRDILGFRQVPRPAFKTNGAWLQRGEVEVHLIDFPNGSFRNTNEISTDDSHFAMRVPDFGAFASGLAQHGYGEDLAAGDPKRIIIRRKGLAGYSQLYLMDADRHLIEVNAEE